VHIDYLRGLALDVPLLVHAESDRLLGEPGPGYAGYLASRPPAAEAVAIGEVSVLEGSTHILHVSSEDGVDAIASGPHDMSGETCPHYLIFTAEDVTGTSFKCAPPIRERRHREALWEGLTNGSLAMVVSDHSPSPPEMKLGDFATAWGGIASLQLRLGATWTGAAERGFDLVAIARWLALAPAALAGLGDRKGSISKGKDADFVVFDPEGGEVIRGAALQHRHPLTPYEGMRLRGKVVSTILRGEQVFDGERVTVGRGRMLTRE
jgi:allantoinase